MHRMHRIKCLVAGGLSGVGALSAAVSVRKAAAQQTDMASAGNGGVAASSASGGAVSIGDDNSGGNAGSAIGVGDTWGGPVAVDGGTMANSTTLGISANGGTAIADASGGDYNLAFSEDPLTTTTTITTATITAITGAGTTMIIITSRPNRPLEA
jgi:hypothetical protein